MKEAHKHRLIGAAILAAVGVLFLPSFFKDNQLYSVDKNSQIPERPKVTAIAFNEPVMPEGIETAPSPDAMFVEGEELPSISLPPSPPELSEELVEAGVTGGDTSAVVSTWDSSSSSSASTKTQLAPPATDNQGLITGYVVRVASLSSKESASRLESQLRSLGHKAYVRSAPLNNGFTYRVFVGPFLDQAEAARVKQSLDSALSVNSWVQKFEP
ncbi:MAG: SPOR domain-containing protein [Cellvibrio sp.]